MGYWEPMGLVDVTRTPYCMVNLGGITLSSSQREGEEDNESPDQGGSFYEVHYINFPLLQWVAKELLGGSCQTDGKLEVSYLSELDPTWHNDSLAAIAFPETLLFSHPETAIGEEGLCALDSVAANAGLPSDKAFWCAGSQGFMYPLDGKVAEQVSPIQGTTLLAERIIFKLHRLGCITDSSPDNVCHEHTDLLMKKSRYRYQMVYPHAPTGEPFGRSTVLWESNQENLLKGDDAGFLIWRKRNCCNY